MTFQKIEMLYLHNVSLYKADEFIESFTSLKVLEIVHAKFLYNGIISLSKEAKRNLTRLVVNKCSINQNNFTIVHILNLISDNELPKSLAIQTYQ